MPAPKISEDDLELLRTAREFCGALLNGADPGRRAYLLCAPLAGYLSAGGVRCRMVEGLVNGTQPHCWLALPDGRILDPHASPFPAPDGNPLPEYYLGDLPPHYEETD